MVYILKPLKKDPWSGFINYPGCHSWIGSVWTRSGNRYTGLTDEDAKRLEKALGYPENHLMPYSKFWITYAVAVPADGIEIDTDVPEGELQYLFLKGHKRVADGSANIKPSNDYVLINAENEAEQSNKKNKIKREAVTAYGKMSLDEMRKCLRLFGIKSDNISADLVESKLFEIVESDPMRFKMQWINNTNKETQFIIEAAIAKNVIRKSKNIYYYGTDIIGKSLQDAIDTLDEKINQDLRIAIIKETEAKA